MTNAYRWASAIVRLARIRLHCDAELTGEGLSFTFHSRPQCRCCGVPLCHDRWLKTIVHGYEYELSRLLKGVDPSLPKDPL